MVDCCELALQNGKLALYIALGAFTVISLLFVMFFGYSVKIDKRTVKLEKKNGKEQHEIDELKKTRQEDRKIIDDLQKEIKELKSRS